MKCAVFTLFIFVGFCHCDDGERVKEVQTRGLYDSRREDEQERPALDPNDFSIRKPPRFEVNHFHPHHHHEPYHSYHTGPSDNDYYRHDFIYRPMDYGGYRTGNEEIDEAANSSIPLDFARSINDYIVSDLLLNVIEDGPDADEQKPLLLSNRFGQVEENETERNAAQIARPAKCIPELTTVRIAKSNDPNIFYVPECTRVERCGGCCSHVLLACQPVETETVTFSVMKTEYTGNKKLKYVGKEPVLVEKHTKCKCGCKIKEEDCNSYQEYRESECRCVCKNLDEEKKCYKNSSKKLWNPDVCACQCREVMPCSTGFQFDYNECRCVQSQLKRRYILTELHKEREPESPPVENTD